MRAHGVRHCRRQQVINVSGPGQPCCQASGVGANFHFASAPGEPMRQWDLGVDFGGSGPYSTLQTADLLG